MWFHGQINLLNKKKFSKLFEKMIIFVKFIIINFKINISI